jgi:hypothetical protein
VPVNAACAIQTGPSFISICNLQFAEPLAKLSGFEVINRFIRESSQLRWKLQYLCSPRALSNEQLAASGRALATLCSGFRCHPSRVLNRLADQTKYFICRQCQDPEHQTGHYLRCSAYSYRPSTELIFEPRINSFDRSPLLKPRRFVRSKFSLLVYRRAKSR